MATARSMISRAMRLIGVLGQNETPEDQELQDAREALNQMLESWSQSPQRAYELITTVMTWPAATATQTIGATGDTVAKRPEEVKYAFQRKGDVDYPVQVLDYDRWLSIPDKTIESNIASSIWSDDAYPDATLSIYPILTEQGSLHLTYLATLQSFSAADTTVALPLGYERAITLSLALEIAPEFGVNVPPSVMKMQAGAMRLVARRNVRVPSMAQGAAYMQSGTCGYYDVYGDIYR